MKKILLSALFIFSFSIGLSQEDSYKENLIEYMKSQGQFETFSSTFNQMAGMFGISESDEKFEKLQKENPNKIITGGYLEPRCIYSSSSYEKIGNFGNESRTIHLGLDFWLPPGTHVNSMFDGEVIAAFNDKGNKEYGGLVITYLLLKSGGSSNVSLFWI